MRVSPPVSRPEEATPGGRPLPCAEGTRGDLVWTSSHFPAGDHDHAALSTWDAPLTDGREYDLDLYGRLAAVLTVPAWRDTVIAHVATRGEAIGTTATTAGPTNTLATTVLVAGIAPAWPHSPTR